MTLSTKISTLSRNELRNLANFCLNFCVQNLGFKKNRKNKLSISVVSDNRKTKFYGQYCPFRNKITVFKNTVGNVKMFIKTFIHEYTHSLQPILRRYYSMLNKYGYINHPFEIEAELNEKYFYKQLWNDYKSKV